MKSKKLIIMLLTLATLSTTVLVGCSSSSSSSAQADKDQYLNIGINTEPQSLDPSRATDLYSSIVLAQVEESLTRCEQDKDGKDAIKPAGAESWTTSEDGLTWTFKLRENKWSDGQVVKASDYEYGIKRTLDPKVASEYAYLLSPIKGADDYNTNKGKVEAVGVKAIDDKTLEFKLTSRCPYFLNLTYFKIFAPQRKDIVDKSGEKFGSEANTMVFSGPFVIKDWTHKSKIELEKNTNYWDKDKVKLAKASIKIIEDDTARMNEILNGSIDVSAAEKQEWKTKFDDTKKFDLVTGFEPTTDYMYFNTKDKLFSNVNIRKAFALSIDREDFTKTLFPGTRVPAYAWVPPTLQIGNEEFRKKADSEPVKVLKDENKDAKALFVKGLQELGMGSDPSQITVTFISGSTSARTKQIEEYKQQVVQKALGCKIKLDYMDWGVFLDKAKKGQYQVASMAWTGDYNDPMTEFDMWVGGSGLNYTGWASPEYDKLIKDAASTSDQKVRFDKFKEAEKMLLHDGVAAAPLDFRQRSIYKKKFVKDFMSPLFGTSYEFKYTYTEGRDAK